MNSLFLSNYLNKIDKKNRVSIPSGFREIISREGSSSVFIFKSITKKCLEGAASSYVNDLSVAINNMDPFSEEKDAFSTAIFGDSVSIDIDGDGRVLIPKLYLNYADIEEDAFFVGKGRTFEIWNKDTFAEHLENCRKFAVENSKLLKWKT
jgi:MraZ protein